MLIGSYRIIEEKGRIGSWTFYVGEKANGRCLLKVSPHLPVDGYQGLLPFLDKIKEKAEQPALLNVPAEIKYKECTYDPKSNRIIIAYQGNHRKITVLDYLSDNKPPDLQKTLWHLGVQMAHAKGWNGLGLSDVLIDNKGCWWPDPLTLRNVFKAFSLNPGYLMDDCDVDSGVGIQNADWSQFNYICDQFFKPSDGLIGETIEHKFSGDLSFIDKFYNALGKCKNRYNAEQNDYRNRVSEILAERAGDFSEAEKPIVLPELLPIRYSFFKEAIPLMHEWFNGYFWEPVNVIAGSSIIQITPKNFDDNRTAEVDCFINVITLTGLILKETGPFRNCENQNSEILSMYNKQGEPLTQGTEITLKNGLTARVVDTSEDGTIVVTFDDQVVDINDLKT